MSQIELPIQNNLDNSNVANVSSNDSANNFNFVFINKYRLNENHYDKFDEMYATVLKNHFNSLSLITQQEFNLFTNNLMDEKFIARYKLLDAISDFTKTEQFTNILSSNLPQYAWTCFDNNAFNYRPYQTW